MQLDVSFLPAFGAAFILMFARLGTMIMLLPGLGERACRCACASPSRWCSPS